MTSNERACGAAIEGSKWSGGAPMPSARSAACAVTVGADKALLREANFHRSGPRFEILPVSSGW